MSAILWILGGFFAAIICSEIVLGKTKLQTGLARVIAVHLCFALALLVYLYSSRSISIPAFLIFWGGAFLSWFGIRSHVESSILLRMLYLLRERQMNRKELLERYESHYGAAHRVEELERGGLIVRGPHGVIVTAKGNKILRIVSMLR